MGEKIARGRKKQRSETQTLLAQFFTPRPIADYMSSMFQDNGHSGATILDPGAGEGILGISLLKRLENTDTEITFVEFDKPTSETLTSIVSSLPSQAKVNVINDDFIQVGLELEKSNRSFSHIILNPPYFKLRVDSPSSITLRQNKIQITNIYAAFVWLSARLLKRNGQLVAIIPRSFCNGPYFLKFREYIANNFSIEGIHTFSSRNKAFSKDSVLQENIILHISKKEQVEHVKVTYSTDQSFEDTRRRYVPINLILDPNDSTRTIHIPAFDQTANLSDYLGAGLQDIGVMVSTGPVVDFRLKDQVLSIKSKGSVPLLYPSHMVGHLVTWPLSKIKKGGQHYEPKNGVTLPKGSGNVKVDSNLLPLDGYFVVVRRFSSKEEKRRIFASIVSPSIFKNQHITFENHLNYFHINKHGIDKELAYGICAYLNSSVLDEHFRKISGHTQVNVSDLKRIPYPSLAVLRKLGRAMDSMNGLIDDIVTTEVLGKIKS